jgi:hypothetical protein
MGDIVVAVPVPLESVGAGAGPHLAGEHLYSLLEQ